MNPRVFLIKVFTLGLTLAPKVIADLLRLMACPETASYNLKMLLSFLAAFRLAKEKNNESSANRR